MVEGGCYVAQGLELDICTQGRTLDELMGRLVKVVQDQIMWNKLERLTEEHILSAPLKYFNRFDKASPIKLPGTDCLNIYAIKMPVINLRMEL